MDNSTPRLTEKEVREIYEMFSKEKLVDTLVNHFLSQRVIYNQFPWKKNLSVELLK